MSLVQFLQQTLLKDVTHNILQQIQQQHSITQSLIDTMSYMREQQKLPIIQQKIKIIEQYIKTRQNILQCIKGLEKQQFQLWINNIFNDQNIIKEMLRMEKNKIEKIIISSVKSIFGFGGQHDEQNSELLIINQGLNKLRILRDCQVNNKKPSRQQVLDASKFDEKFKIYQHKFHLKIQKFNQSIQNYIKQIRRYQIKVRQQFQKILEFEQNTMQRDSPFKQLPHNKDQDIQSTKYNIQIDPMATNTYFYRRNQLPLRNTYFYDTY